MDETPTTKFDKSVVAVRQRHKAFWPSFLDKDPNDAPVSPFLIELNNSNKQTWLSSFQCQEVISTVLLQSIT